MGESEIFTEVEDFIQSQTPSDSAISLKEFLELHPLIQKQWLRNQALKTPSQAELRDMLKWLHGNPEGGSQKEIGGAKLKIQSNTLKIL